jgi:hypothetical protein
MSSPASSEPPTPGGSRCSSPGGGSGRRHSGSGGSDGSDSEDGGGDRGDLAEDVGDEESVGRFGMGFVRKVQSVLDEYLVILDIDEVKYYLGEWDHDDATAIVAEQIVRKSIEADDQQREDLGVLLGELIGEDWGISADMFAAAVASFAPDLPELIFDVPMAHTHLGR